MTTAVLQEYINSLVAKSYSHSTIVETRNILHKSLADAVYPLCFLSSNPAEYIKIPIKRAMNDAPTNPHIYIPPKQFAEILLLCPKEHFMYLPWILGYRCGFGHKNIGTTLQIYAHVTEKMSDRTINILNMI